MRTVSDLLRQLPDEYARLEDALLPGGNTMGGERVTGGGGIERPAPLRMDVAEHRHKLVRGLRWWVDAVRDPDETTRVGESVALMCAWLLGHLDAMDDTDRGELRTNLHEWVSDAWGWQGDAGPGDPVALPAGAVDQVVRVADAARILGCSVRTIQRRAPREGGMVRLGDVMPRCAYSDLPPGQCAHCAM